jgi:Protein of unknown function (DUF4087)
MRSLILSALIVALTPQMASAAEKRCGWVINPTPANWSLTDRDGEWLMSLQGGYSAPGMDELPDMTTKGWVRTNRNYGYGCACLSVDTNIDEPGDPVFWGRIKRIYSAKPVPLRQCRTDKKLPKP